MGMRFKFRVLENSPQFLNLNPGSVGFRARKHVVHGDGDGVLYLQCLSRVPLRIPFRVPSGFIYIYI